MKKYITLAVIVILIVVLIKVFSPSVSENKDGYSIGSILPLSGPASNIGEPYAEGMRMAAEDINKAGGIKGKQLSVFTEDGQFSGSKSISAAQSLLSVHNPDAITTLFHLPAVAVSPVVANAGKPFLHWDYSRSVIKDNQLAFKTGFDAETGCQSLIQYAKDHKTYKKLGVLMSKTPYNQDCFNGLKKAEGNVSEYWYEFGEKDFKTLLTKAKRDGVDALVTIPIDPEPVLMFKQLSDLGYPIKFICATASECIYPNVVQSASSKTLEGTLSIDFIPSSLTQSVPATRFEEKYNKKPSSTELTWIALGYDDTAMIAEAMKSCTPHDSKCVGKELSTIKNYGSYIDSNGFKDRIQQLNLKIKQYVKGNWVDVQ